MLAVQAADFSSCRSIDGKNFAATPTSARAEPVEFEWMQSASSSGGVRIYNWGGLSPIEAAIGARPKRQRRVEGNGIGERVSISRAN